MRRPDPSRSRAPVHPPRTGRVLGLLLFLSLFLAAPASATYEQVKTFAGNEPLFETSALAVNSTGAGGVPAGTLYAASTRGTAVFPGAYAVASFTPKGERLGTWKGFDARGIAVDQTTGYVFVLTGGFAAGSPGNVKVFSADGSKLIATIGQVGAPGETIAEGPEKIHEPWAIAVDDSGTVYVVDQASDEGRIMAFEPQSPGDYEHYVYAGRADDLKEVFARHLALDSAGHLYASLEASIQEFDLADPSTPVCELEVPGSGAEGMTVNPQSGEVFYFSFKNGKIHQLAPCNSQGELVETASFALTPKPVGGMEALALNPALAYEASRPPGILYAASHSTFGGLGYISAAPEIHPPSVESESVASVTSSTATLGAQINPKGSPTRYVFQYITDTAYQANEPSERFAGAVEAPLGAAALGSGQEVLSAAVALVGLTPDTEYHYRVIATSPCDPEHEAELCEDTGDAQAFHTFPLEAPGLPDNRAWELVSPAQKQGGEVVPAEPQTASCGLECKPSTFGNTFPMQSSPDGKAVVYEGFPFSTSEGAARFNEYLSKRTGSGWQTTILSPSLDGSHSAFDAELTNGLIASNVTQITLSPEAPAGYANLYTQDTANPLALIPLITAPPPNRNPRLTFAGASADFSQLFFEANDALSGETPFAPPAVDGGEKKNNLYESVNGQLRLVNILPGNGEAVPGAEFGSGKQLKSGNVNDFRSDFSNAISDDGSRVFWSDEAGQVYVREDGESTRAIPDPGKFLTAAADGSKVLLSNGHSYDLETEETTDLTAGEGGFEGIIGQSENLSRIYFIDTAVLDEEENDYGAKAQVGKDNLYAWREGVTTFIATLVATDNSVSGASGHGAWQAAPPIRTAEASPDGRWVAFQSKAPLTGYDNTCSIFDPNTLKYGIGPCMEVFLYDSDLGKLICPVCNPSGTRPLGWSTLGVILNAAAAFPQPRYLTDEGRLFFDSQDSLSAFDTNDGVEDVYEYEPQGIGSCKRAGGCVSLISAGHEPIDSNFLAADATGKSIFFTSRDQLVLKDRDDLIDVYVAREDGGIPAETETARSECQGETCQPAAVVPNDPTPGSSSFEGAGNVVEKKTTRKHRKKKRKHQAKKHRRKRANHNRGGAK